MFIFFLLVTPLLPALFLKVFAFVFRVENRSFKRCYIAMFLCCGLLLLFGVYGPVDNQFIFAIIKLVIFGLATRLVLNANFIQVAVIATLLSIIFTVTVTRNSEEENSAQAISHVVDRSLTASV